MALNERIYKKDRIFTEQPHKENVFRVGRCRVQSIFYI